ncbi:hypothetical protein [Brunnivagina elsteri]|uniref:PEP-CTERM sorting domain-containing protein n=1 Tax=Brunnivagina elsteri CCALA 953 TaxID=987040 RepID=A0A2A2TLU3_9CYAN|nr:hypothetical protein [Calothrix elsteri]PAX59438.1 hypothetical protein CK510_07040 [Calothrix elsteri CCALA 953]
MKIFYLTLFLLLGNIKTTLAASLVPTINYTGAVTQRPGYMEMTTATGARSASILSQWLKTPLGSYGTEGSIITFNLNPNFRYEFEWQFETVERDKDIFGIWNGKTFTTLATGTTATLPIANTTKRTSPWLKTTITNTQTLSLVVMDTRDKLGTSMVRIKSFNQIPEPSMVVGFVTVVVVGMKFKRTNNSRGD